MGEDTDVLIETLWNVKHKTGTDIPDALFRINRNIVECKEREQNSSFINLLGINRNIVECKA